MIRVHVFCEGQTEETFVREILQPHFNTINVFLYPIIVRTSKYGKGGVSTYGKIKFQIEKKCKEDSLAWVTTLLDYYKFPHEFLELNNEASSIDQAQAVEAAFQDDIAQSNFIAHLIIHEFEGLLFSAPHKFSCWFNQGAVDKLSEVRNKFVSPEHINDGITTAPSKRILNICNTYDKVLHGSLIALDIGLNSIRKECPLFDKWMRKVEALSDI